MSENPQSTSYFTATNSDIIFAEFPKNLEINIERAKEMVIRRLDMMHAKKHFVVIDISNIKAVTKDAKEFLQQRDTGLKNILGAAFIATNPVAVMIANIFVKARKDFEARVFSNKQEAFDWIFTQRKIITQQLRN